MTDTQEQATPVVETPAVPNFDEAAEAEAAIEEAEKAPRPTRRKRESADTTARRQVAYERGEASKDKQYDEWIEDWDWSQPRMHCTVKRTSPNLHLGQQVGGRLDSKANGFFTEEEIQQRFGGGTFIVYVSGIDQRTGKFRALGNKQVVIGAEPRIDAKPQQVVDAGTGAPHQQGGSGVSDLAPQAQAGLVGMIDKSFDRLAAAQQRQPSGDPELMKEVYEGQVRTVKEAADKEAANLREQMSEMRQELSQLRIERDTYQHKVETEVTAARSEGERYVGQMIPAFAAQANDRVQQILHDTGEKVRSIQEQYAHDLQNQQAYFQQQLQNQQTLFQAAESNMQTMFQGQIAHLQTINTTLQAKIDSLEGECRGLRDQVLNMHQEVARKQDPLARLQEMQTFQDVIQGMSGRGGGDDDLGEDASPALRLAARFAPAIAGAIDVAKAKMGIGDGQQMMPQQMMQQQPQQMRAPQMVPPGAVPRIAAPRPAAPGMMVKAPQPAQPQQAKPAPRRVRIPRADAQVRKQDLIAGVALLNAAIASGTDPQAAANTAASQIDRNTLNALCARKPEVVIQSLQGAGILRGAVASEPGLQYLTAFLLELQGRLNPPPALPTTKQPEVAQAAEQSKGEEPSDGNEA